MGQHSKYSFEMKLDALFHPSHASVQAAAALRRISPAWNGSCALPIPFWKCHSCTLDLCQYFRQKMLKDYAAFLSSSSSFCCGVK